MVEVLRLVSVQLLFQKNDKRLVCFVAVTLLVIGHLSISRPCSSPKNVILQVFLTLSPQPTEEELKQIIKEADTKIEEAKTEATKRLQVLSDEQVMSSLQSGRRLLRKCSLMGNIHTLLLLERIHATKIPVYSFLSTLQLFVCLNQMYCIIAFGDILN